MFLKGVIFNLGMKRFLFGITLPTIATFLIFTAILFCFNKHEKSGLKPASQIDSQYSYTASNSQIPNFSQITDISKKKKLFFNFMRPAVEAENAKIMFKRRRLIKLFNKKYYSRNNIEEIKEIATEYKISDFDITNSNIKEKLLSRVDIIPVSLALVQSANETAWGTSRFARLGNNMFGEWSFKKGEGIIPERRDSGATHEVAKFPNINKSVSSYMQNLNTGKSYASLRKIRQEMRGENREPAAINLANGLTKYSSLGQKYVSIISSMLKSNNQYL